MDNQYCVFLRGINVNGIKITMNELKEAFRQMGFSNVATVLATGNVIILEQENSRDRRGLKLFIEKSLSEHFNYDAHILLRSQEEIAHICSASQSVIVPEEYHNYFILCDDEVTLSELEQFFGAVPHMLREQFLLSEYGAFWVVPKCSTLESDFGAKVLGDKKYKSRLTSRNMNTIEKINKCMLK